MKNKKGAPKGAFRRQYLIKSDNVHVHASNCTVEVSANHLLAVASHHALAGCEVFWREDGRSDDQRYVRSVDVTSLEVGSALVTDKNLVTREVGVFVDCESVA